MGRWMPHTSSVDFCERDYEHTPWVAEMWNAVSSLLTIALFPAIGLVFSNPTKEWRFTLQFVVMLLCGVGSFLLHATLQSTWQASDELPMLLLNYLFLFTLLDLPSSAYPRGSMLHTAASALQPHRPRLALAVAAIVALQVAFYTAFQQSYGVFIATYSFLVVVIIFWSYYFSTTHPLLRLLFWRSIFAYVVVGFFVWVWDMNWCTFLHAQVYKHLPRGFTFHVLWHVGAAFGTYLEILALTVVRVLHGGGGGGGARRLPELHYILGGLFPVVRLQIAGGGEGGGGGEGEGEREGKSRSRGGRTKQN